jgi:hypothetical protein
MTLAAKPVHVEEGEWLAHQGLFNLILGWARSLQTTQLSNNIVCSIA